MPGFFCSSTSRTPSQLFPQLRIWKAGVAEGLANFEERGSRVGRVGARHGLGLREGSGKCFGGEVAPKARGLLPCGLIGWIKCGAEAHLLAAKVLA